MISVDPARSRSESDVINQMGTNNGGLRFADFSRMFGNPGTNRSFVTSTTTGATRAASTRSRPGLVYRRHTSTRSNPSNEFSPGTPEKGSSPTTGTD